MTDDPDLSGFPLQSPHAPPDDPIFDFDVSNWLDPPVYVTKPLRKPISAPWPNRNTVNLRHLPCGIVTSLSVVMSSMVSLLTPSWKRV